MNVPAVFVLVGIAHQCNNSNNTRYAAFRVQGTRAPRVVEFYACMFSHDHTPLSKHTDSHAYQIVVIEHLDEIVRYFRPCATRLCPQLTDSCTNSGQTPHRELISCHSPRLQHVIGDDIAVELRRACDVQEPPVNAYAPWRYIDRRNNIALIDFELQAVVELCDSAVAGVLRIAREFRDNGRDAFVRLLYLR